MEVGGGWAQREMGQVDGGAVLGGESRKQRLLESSSHGHLSVKLPTQLFILCAEGF